MISLPEIATRPYVPVPRWHLRTLVPHKFTVVRMYLRSMTRGSRRLWSRQTMYTGELLHPIIPARALTAVDRTWATLVALPLNVVLLTGSLRLLDLTEDLIKLT